MISLFDSALKYETFFCGELKFFISLFLFALKFITLGLLAFSLFPALRVEFLDKGVGTFLLVSSTVFIKTMSGEFSSYQLSNKSSYKSILSLGFLSRSLVIIVLQVLEISIELGKLYSPFTIFLRISSSQLPSNGYNPNTIRYKITPRAHISILGLEAIFLPEAI